MFIAAHYCEAAILYPEVPFILHTEIVKMCPFVVSSASPVLLPTVNPLKVMVPALPLLIAITRQLLSATGAAKVKAPPLVKYCCGTVPQTSVCVPLEKVPRLPDVISTPPDRAWLAPASCAAPVMRLSLPCAAVLDEVP